MGCEGAIIHRDLENREGRTPKTLGFFSILALIALRVSCGAAKGRAEAKADGLGVRDQELGVEIRGRCREEVYSSPTNR